MRRIFAVLFCCVILSLPVYADNAAAEVAVTGAVSPNGSCQVAMNVSIRLDEPVDSLLFPLGSNVSSIRLNGANATLLPDGNITNIKLDTLNGMTGSFPITIHYTINSVLSTDDDGKTQVSVPLLCGFKYPVEKMDFSITMPDSFDSVPTYFSGYHEQDIERSITSEVNGAIITGSITEPLKDSETLTLKLTPPDDMFPQNLSLGKSLFLDHIAMAVCALLALGYWLFTMGARPLWPIHRSTAPDGLSAGNVGSYLVHKKADLTMMVVHWAQLGYLIIHLDENGRVLLYKKMEMGNERGKFEQRIFTNLFGKGDRIDATSYRYTKQCEKTALLSRRYAAGYLPNSGNPTLFRILSCLVPIFAGIAMGDSLSSSPIWRVIWMILMPLLCVVCSWFIQDGMDCLHLNHKSKLEMSGLCIAIILAAGLFSHGLIYAIIVILWSILVGLAAAYGGKRSENGARIYQEILGMRRHMKKVSKSELIRIMRTNPDYYYELVPFALALGVDKQLALRFDSLHIPNCTWLLTGTGPVRTASEFCPILRETVKAMDAERHRTLLEKLLHVK